MKKKKYSKPQVTRVQLVLQKPVLGECFSVDQGSPYPGICNDENGTCPQA